MKNWLLGLGGMIVSCASLAQGPAVRLVVTNDVCLVSTCPGTNPPAPTTVSSGLPFTIYVTAVDASNARVTNLTATVGFSSSDPLATLPSGFTFSPADQGVRTFANGAVFRTLGVQTITVTDAAGVLAPGRLTLTVTGIASQQIPTISPEMMAFFALALALTGLWLARLRR